MNTTSLRCLLLCLGLLAVVGAGLGDAGDADAEQRLEALRARIAVIEREQREAAERR
ncbi:hypothetical protein G6N75_00995, partial [Thioalkalivibrio sp. XN8]|nr:hypothetical protein [Thioalkalivibrio sp. XN8]